jgi:hypothetical protein
MVINISIDGVLRNFLQKFEYHYVDYYINSDVDNDSFEYLINRPVHTIDDFKFQSKDEQDMFTYVEFPLEIFGHAGLNSPTSISDINKLIFENKKITFNLIGLNEYGKSKPSTLFFLSKNGFLGNSIKFTNSDNIKKEWKNCDVWITDNEEIIKKCPTGKKCFKFNTEHNGHFYYKNEINNIKQIEELCLNYLEKSTTSISMLSIKNVISKLTNLQKKIKKMGLMNQNHPS